MIFGKSFVDQKLLFPEQYQDLVWFLFPSEVTTELVGLKRGSSFAALKAHANEASQNQPFDTPFQPRDYNKHTYAFEFSRDLMADDDDGNESTATQDS